VNPRKHPAAAAFLVCVGLAVEVYFLGFHRSARVEPRGAHRVALKEFGAGMPLMEIFTMQNDGFKGIRLRFVATEPADVTFHWRLSERVSSAPIIENREEFRGMSGDTRVELVFPEIARSSQKIYQLEIRASPPTSKPVAAVAWLDDALPGATFHVGGQDRWGDLAFETVATGDTIYGRLWLASASLFEHRVRGLVLLAFTLAIYNVLLAAIVVHLWPRAGATLPTTEPAAAYRWPTRWSAIAALLFAVIAAASAFANYRRRPAVDLIEEFHTAELHASMETHVAFVLTDAVVDGRLMNAIAAHPDSEITWTVVVPPGARLLTAIATVPDVWTLHGDGVVFRIGVTENGTYSELLMHHLDPARVAADRRWVPLKLDLSPFSGRRIRLTFRTDASPPGKARDSHNDWARWGAPRIVTN
jgi:hypothetical protein